MHSHGRSGPTHHPSAYSRIADSIIIVRLIPNLAVEVELELLGRTELLVHRDEGGKRRHSGFRKGGPLHVEEWAEAERLLKRLEIEGTM